MWLALVIILILLWVGGFLLFHIAGFALHILLIVAVVSLVIHLLTGAGSSSFTRCNATN